MDRTHINAGAAVILASVSPRRHELLSRLLPAFATYSSPVEESGSSVELPISLASLPLPPQYGIEAGSDPRLWAWRKVVDVHAQLPGSAVGSLLLGADTVVVVKGRLLGKPHSPDEAVEMLELLCGKPQYVVTGFVLAQASKAGEEPHLLHAEGVVSRVIMRSFSREEALAYVATGEPMDKAGSYALQGLGGALVEEVEGCRTNVIGLPLCHVRAALLRLGVEVLPYPGNGYCGNCPA